ncbi:MBL fold metallo-hydrolase [Teredinibacter sp. KSP-S5-2]|uniref:MBL fold metallo-hydrolase n=1 Tax=Teredinibacter sp. KSP-S5-2 TaxID=3034506 RepID=UPI00293526A8|nr:MBL fold metallo-hydrolase [Teredinibacter sp. KSP-S5-2]WNO10664.1 MBL fold metallo-hydrolase [Teredinibacter sp. KSP-S5-2]
MSELKITILIDNTVNHAGLLAEHGLSIWIATREQNILFDTGQGLALKHNSKQLKIDLSSTDALVLSHGHYDHTGGVDEVLQLSENASVFIHPEALKEKYSLRSNNPAHYRGMATPIKNLLHNTPNIYWTEKPTPIAKNVWCTGSIPRINDFEKNTKTFFYDKDGKSPDQIMDDQALYIESGLGTIVLLGCAHAGVINTLEYIQYLTHNKPIFGVFGGMHLANASTEQLESTIKALRKLNIQQLGPTHCTGFAAMKSLAEAFPDQYQTIHVGSVIHI